LKLCIATVSRTFKDAVKNLSKNTGCLITDSNWPPSDNKSSAAPFKTTRSVLFNPLTPELNLSAP
jgi:hypothetical protein